MFSTTKVYGVWQASSKASRWRNPPSRTFRNPTRRTGPRLQATVLAAGGPRHLPPSCTPGAPQTAAAGPHRPYYFVVAVVVNLFFWFCFFFFFFFFLCFFLFWTSGSSCSASETSPRSSPFFPPPPPSLQPVARTGCCRLRPSRNNDDGTSEPSLPWLAGGIARTMCASVSGSPFWARVLPTPPLPPTSEQTISFSLFFSLFSLFCFHFSFFFFGGGGGGGGDEGVAQYVRSTQAGALKNEPWFMPAKRLRRPMVAAGRARATGSHEDRTPGRIALSMSSSASLKVGKTEKIKPLLLLLLLLLLLFFFDILLFTVVLMDMNKLVKNQTARVIEHAYKRYTLALDGGQWQTCAIARGDRASVDKKRKNEGIQRHSAGITAVWASLSSDPCPALAWTGAWLASCWASCPARSGRSKNKKKKKKDEEEEEEEER